MSYLFDVEFEEANLRDRQKRRWWDDSDSVNLSVPANDVEHAIRKVRKKRIGRRWDWDEDSGKKHKEKVVDLRVLSVKLVREIDIA